MKPKISILLILTIMLPMNAAAMSAPPYRPPASVENTPISLPFPMTDAPVGITFAALNLSWGENDYSTAPYRDAPYYPIDFTGEYTVRYNGVESAVVEIAVPFLGMTEPEPNILVDGKTVEPGVYFSLIPLEYEEGTPLMADYINNVREQAKPYIPHHFEPDAQAKLYTFTQYGPDHSNIGIEITLEYDPVETLLLISAPFDMEPHINYCTYIDSGEDTEPTQRLNGHYYGEARTVQFHRVTPFEVLVVGNDTLSWRTHEQNSPEKSGGFYLSVSEPKNETPREFITRIQDEKVNFFEDFQYPILPDDFLLHWTDRMLDLQSEIPSDVIHNFANIQCIDHLNLRSYCMFMLNHNYINQYIMMQQSLVVPITFEPNEERVLSISYRPVTGMEWSESKNQSLFHSMILTEAANYWDFFDRLTIITNHPDGVIESVIPNGFIETGSNYVLEIQSAPRNNISIGFVMPDERQKPLAYWITPTQLFTLIILAVIILTVFLAKRSVQKRGTKKDIE